MKAMLHATLHIPTDSVGLIPRMNTTKKYIAFRINPKGTPSLAHSPLVMPSLPAEMMLGMLPGMSMPPEMSRPYKAALICCWLIAGEISAAVKVALSRMADIMFTQKRM
jgi:hypothetical protein